VRTRVRESDFDTGVQRDPDVDAGTVVQGVIPLQGDVCDRLDLVFAIWQGDFDWADTRVGGYN